MNDTSLLLRLAVALAIGLLIGLERGWQQRDEAEGERTAGKGASGDNPYCVNKILPW